MRRFKIGFAMLLVMLLGVLLVGCDKDNKDHDVKQVVNSYITIDINHLLKLLRMGKV